MDTNRNANGHELKQPQIDADLRRWGSPPVERCLACEADRVSHPWLRFCVGLLAAFLSRLQR